MGARNRRMRRVRRQCSSLGEAQRQIRPTVRVALLRRRTRATQHTPYVERPKRSLRFLTSVVARRPWRRLRKVRPRDKHDVSLNWILPRAPDQQQLHVVPRANTRYTTAPTELRERIQRANHNACTAARGTSPTERGAQGEAARARPGVRTGPQAAPPAMRETSFRAAPRRREQARPQATRPRSTGPDDARTGQACSAAPPLRPGNEKRTRPVALLSSFGSTGHALGRSCTHVATRISPTQNAFRARRGKSPSAATRCPSSDPHRTRGRRGARSRPH